MYADNLAITVGGLEIDSVHDRISGDLECITNWCDKYMLTINTDKTHVLWCTPEKEALNEGDTAFC